MTIWERLRLWAIRKLGGVNAPEKGFIYIVRRCEPGDIRGQ
jgi:hypothetical protein